jgi:hypothetical protein
MNVVLKAELEGMVCIGWQFLSRPECVVTGIVELDHPLSAICKKEFESNYNCSITALALEENLCHSGSSVALNVLISSCL